MNVYRANPYKTVTFSEEKRQRNQIQYVLKVFHKLENNGLCDIRNA